MCGIAGVFGRSDPETVRKMLRRLAHRGPDDEFLVSGRRFSLGAARLAILDVEGGRQPLSNERGDVWAVQNGEIYNFPELRARIQARHDLRTRTDTEILPHLYEDHGEDFTGELCGMFAVAIWDERQERGVLARDPVGEKPLYYLEQDGGLYFASEIKALLVVPGYARRLDPASVHHYLSFKHVPGPRTAFQGILSLGPAQILVHEPGRRACVRTYARFSWATDPELARADEQEIAARLIDALREGVRRRLLSDVPVGFYLSGGLDSSLSTALAAMLSPGRIKTFTLTYDEESTTAGKEADRRCARLVAERYGTDHHEERLSAREAAHAFPRLLRHFDQPFAGTVSSYFLAKLVGSHVKVALSGDGADELFGSYLSHRLAPVVAAYLEEGERAFSKPGFDENPPLVRSIADADTARWRSRLFVFPEAEKRALYSEDFAASLEAESSEARLAADFAGLTAGDPLNRMLEAEFRGIFPDQVLAFVDRLSMAHSLEVRPAYLDADFVRLAASLPGCMKAKHGEVKSILKLAAAPYLPAAIIGRAKEGFVLPINRWLAEGLRDFMQDVLSRDSLARAQLLRPEAVASLVERFLAGENALANRMLSLVSLQLFWDDYFGASRAY